MSTTPQTLRTAGVSAARDYQNIPAWQKSLALTEVVYNITEKFPTREHAGLSATMRASALSIATSIAAASGRNNEFGMADSYSKAQSATAELTTLLALATRLDFLDATVASSTAAMIEEISRLIVGLKHGLKVAAKNAERNERMEREAAAAEREERPARREYKPRDSGSERPARREFKPRDSAPSSDRKPYGDRKPSDNRKPYGDKKSYSDRKPRSDKPFRKPRD